MRAGTAIIAAVLLILASTPLHAEVKRAKFTSANRYLIVETLADDLMHFEFSASGTGPASTVPLYTSPMVLEIDYSGPSTYSTTGGVIETSELRAAVHPQNLCISLTDKIRGLALTTICPANLENDWKGIDVAKGNIANVYGLGQQFKRLGSADGDWLQHKVREAQPAGQQQAHGNGFMPFGQAGMVGNVQYPVMYALGNGNLNYALFLDNVYKQNWDFAGDPWQVRMWGDQIRFYIMTGPDLPNLRKDFLNLVGTAPVPPRKAFGLWVSEYGYKNWQQIGTLRDGLRRDNFPLDGFVLDLQWFGGVTPNSPDSHMGRLNWDTAPNDGNGIAFTNPSSTVASLKSDNVGLITIEESYLSENTDTLSQMRSAGKFLAYQRNNGVCDQSQQQPIFLSDWFGKAAMIDWSNPDAGQWIHDNRRFPNLVKYGIAGHWTDLGEPEKYDPGACYRGVETTASGPKNQHGDIHNLYAFLWNKSIYDGFVAKNNSVTRRPFIVSRSGAAGLQRFGVATWSGDIGSNLQLLATQQNAQMHMSMSGIDYYGSDIGGFRREGMPYNEGHSGNLQYQKELYTQWFANGSWFDTPVRPHTDNAFQSQLRYETAPNLVGDLRSNKANLRQRYELIPYYYSLAYRAFLFGEPVVPPLVFYYQNDPVLRTAGHEKLIGKDLLVGVVASHGEYARNIYLPKGTWVNYHTRDWFKSNGQWINNFPLYIDGIFRLPAFARAGAILPMMYVDDQTKDAFGTRKNGTKRNELNVQIYADPARSSFTVYEDDGESIAFTAAKRPSYRYRTTEISQQLNTSQNTVEVTIKGSQGSYPGAPVKRKNMIRLVVDNAKATKVMLNGISLPLLPSSNTSSTGWLNAGRNIIYINTGALDVSKQKTLVVSLQPVHPVASANLVCDSGWSSPGEAIYAVGSVPALGSWDPAKAVPLSSSIYYEYIYNPSPNHNGPGPKTPKWTGVVSGLPSGATIEWKCVKKTTSGQWQFMPGRNSSIQLPVSGFGGTSTGTF